MDKCGKCGMDIESEAVRTTGSVYHAACFKCEVCKWASLHCLDHNLFFIHFHFLQLLYQVQPVRYIVLNRWSKQALLSSGWLISTRPPPHFIIINLPPPPHHHHDDHYQDYTKRFAAHCSVCKMAIVPKEGQTKVGGNYICLKIVTLESHENLEGNQNDFYSLFHS